MFNRKTRLLSLCLMAMLLFGFLTPALATGKIEPWLPLYGGQASYYACEIHGMPDNAKLVSAKSSDTKIMKTMIAKNELLVKALKAGKATITVKYKVGGKTTTVKDTLYAEKFPKIFKSLKVAGKTVDLKKNVGGYTLKKYKKNSAKIDVTVAKGWEINSIWGYADGKELSISNHKSFKIPKKKNAFVCIEVYNDKGQYIPYEIEIKR